jgi:hypothetical protein
VKIKVTDENLTKIWDALDRANGEARKNAALPGDIFALANRAEASLIASGLPTRGRSGCEVVWHAGGPSANAYSYKMLRTRITLTRGTESWFLTGLERIGVYPRQSELYRITISPAQRQRSVAVALTAFQARDKREANTAPAANGDGLVRD